MHTENDSMMNSARRAERSPVRRFRWLFLVVSGVLTGLTVVFPLLGVLEWVSLVPAMLVLYDVAEQEEHGNRLRKRRWYALGLVFFFCYYLVNYHWFLSMYPLEFTGLTHGAALFVVFFAWWGLSLFQALGASLVFVAFFALSRLPLLRRHRALEIPMVAALWVVLEWGQTLGWVGVPWARLPLGQVGTPVMIGVASYFGSYVITFSLVLFNAAFAYALQRASGLRLGAAVCAGALLFVAGGGLLSVGQNTADENADTPSLRVALIQGNIGSADKWDMDSYDMFDVYYTLTKEAAEGGAELIVWPETAVPITLLKYPHYLDQLRNLAKQYGTTLLLGTFTEDRSEETYNSMIMVYADGTVSDTVYSKRHLVPFGEYIPLEDFFRTLVPPLADLVQANVQSGDSAAVWNEEFGSVGALICFDSIYETLALDSVRNGAQLLTISTNDSWFFDSAAGRMHVAQAQLRAVETGRWVVRAASTGISAVITSTGEIVSQQEALTQGVLIGDVPLKQGTTLYVRIGNAFVWLCLAFLLAVPLESLTVFTVSSFKKRRWRNGGA